MARHKSAVALGQEARPRGAAHVLTQLATVVEGTDAVRDLGEAGHGTRNLVQAMPLAHAAPTAAVALRQGGEQPLGIGVLRVGHDARGLAHLHDAARVHDGYLLRHLRDHAEVVRDEDETHLLGLAQFKQQVHDLGLNGHVEGRCRFVGDDEARRGEQGYGDDDALAHAAGELVRVLLEPLLGRGDVDLAQLVEGDLFRLAAAHLLVRENRLHHLRADGEHRVQRHHGILEDHADAVAADVTQRFGIGGDEVVTLEQHRAAGDEAGLADEVDDGEAGDGLARSRLAHKSETFATAQRERDVVHGGERFVAESELDGEVLDVEQRFHG